MENVAPSSAPYRRLGARLLLALLVAAGAAVALTLLTARPAAADIAGDEAEFLRLLNGSRGSSGLGPLSDDRLAAGVGRDWSGTMAARDNLAHNPDVAAQVTSRVTRDWARIGENVGVGGSIPALHDAFMNSASHLANVLGDYNRVGVGVVRSGNTIWVTFVFIKGPAIAAPPPPPPPQHHAVGWYLRDALTSGIADRAFSYGTPGDLSLIHI